MNGLVGLTAFWASMLLPVVLLWRRCPPRYWAHPNIAPAAALAVVLLLQMIDNLFNVVGDPVLILAAGGLAGLKRAEIALALKPRLSALRRQIKLPSAIGTQITRG